MRDVPKIFDIIAKVERVVVRRKLPIERPVSPTGDKAHGLHPIASRGMVRGRGNSGWTSSVKPSTENREVRLEILGEDHIGIIRDPLIANILTGNPNLSQYMPWS